MKCPKCQTENREARKFCFECGAKLVLVCVECGFENLPGEKFCGECGHAVAEPRDAPSIDYDQPQSYTPKFLADKILTTRSSIEGERKLVTVLFADVANYTSISEKLDPEEVHQIMDGCFKILMDEIHKFEGTINQFTGDGVMALFGAPVAHEDHAQRACHAALSIQKALRKYDERLKDDLGIDFKMRIGLNSGRVIVGSIGDDLRMDYTAVGDTTNLAARIQQTAKPSEVWLSQDTQSIIRGFFQVESVGDLELKGKAEPQPTYRLVAEHKEVRTRFEAGLVKGVTELVGRLPEMEILKTAWERAKSGEARMVDVVGEAGVGKSRLAYEFQRAIADEATILTGVCIHYGRNINFLPLIDIVRAAFDIEEGMTEEEVGDRIEEKATENLTTMIPFYRNLLSLKVDDPQFNALDPEGRKFGTFEAVKDLLLPLSEEKPMVIFLEDIHWIDKISEEFFTYFSRCMLDHSVLMLAAYRPEGSPPWAQGAHYQRLGLETLNTESSIRLVRNVLGGVALEPDLAQKIAEKTGGNPFFVEEIVREFLERGDLEKAGDRYICSRPIHQLEIPNTIQGVLAARMDRLSEDLKQTMQVASVIGRDFGFRILKYITELGEDLKTYLGNLVGLEILYEKALYPELEYIFKHALTQEVAYNSLLKQRRQEVHGRIALAIEELYADRLEEHYELLAHHYGRSGDAPKAVQYLILSGEKSNQHNAVQAAAEFFVRALEVAQSGDVPLDGETEVRLHFGQALANFSIGALGQSVEGFRKAVELSRKQGMIEYEKKCLLHLTPFIWQWPVQAEAEQMYKECIARTRELEDKGLEVLFLTGMAGRVAIYEEPYRANQMHIEAGRMAMESGDPVAISMHRMGRHWTERWLGHPQKAIELTEGLVEAMSEMFLLSYLVLVIGGRAVALAEVGRVEDGMAVLRYGIDMCEKFGALWRVGVLYNCLGYCHNEIYQPKRAWSLNLKSEKVARSLMEQHPMGTRQWAEIISHASVNQMENLFDQRKPDEAWGRMKAFEEEFKSQDFDMARPYVELRMAYFAAQTLLQRKEVHHAKRIIEENLKRARQKQVKKRVGGFLRLLGEVQMRQGETESAIANLNEAVITLKELGNPRQLWQAHASLASGYHKMGRSSEAKDQWGAAGAVIQGLANGLSDRELRQGFLQAEPIRAILSKAES